MTNCYINESVVFKRCPDDGLIHPTCGRKPIREGDTVCYEIPARSTSENFKLDIFRYTMQCVYSGESLFPVAFNQEPPDDSIKVFFDYVFRTTYRRNVSEKLALALYAHNDAPFLFKTLGIFEKNGSDPNCLRVSYQNGESFIAATRDVGVGEALTISPEIISVPTVTQEGDVSNTLSLMTTVNTSNAHLFLKALAYRKNASRSRPKGRVFKVNSTLDPGLDKRIAKYTIDKEMGITDFHVGVDKLYKKSTGTQEEDDLDLEELFKKTYEAFQADQQTTGA